MQTSLKCFHFLWQFIGKSCSWNIINCTCFFNLAIKCCTLDRPCTRDDKWHEKYAMLNFYPCYPLRGCKRPRKVLWKRKMNYDTKHHRKINLRPFQSFIEFFLKQNSEGYKKRLKNFSRLSNVFLSHIAAGIINLELFKTIFSHRKWFVFVQHRGSLMSY